MAAYDDASTALALESGLRDPDGLVRIGALRGAGDTRAMLLISLLALWMFRVPVALGLGLLGGFGLTGMWVGAGINYLTIAGASLARSADGASARGGA